LSGKRFDLNTEDCSGSIPVTDILASRGSGIGAERLPREEEDEEERTARSFSIFFGRASFESRRDEAREVIRAT
jgi:hypothetical protein